MRDLNGILALRCSDEGREVLNEQIVIRLVILNVNRGNYLAWSSWDEINAL
jgi:hypothetical protein